MRRAKTETIIAAMRILAEDIHSEDGVANAAIREAADRLQELHDRLSAHCEWVRDDDDDSYDGACGAKWTFIDGGPVENGMDHCPQCGGWVTLK